MNDNLPIEMFQQLSNDNGKNVVISVEVEKEFSSPPFKGPLKKVARNNTLLFSKLFNGILKISLDSIELDNTKRICQNPKADLGYEIELDFILVITLRNGKYFMNYYDKETKEIIDLPFEGFMYFGAR